MNLKRHLSYARGYIELGLVAEAAEELRQIPPPFDESPEVLTLSMAVLHEKRDWTALAILAAEFVRRTPDDPAGWVTWAYAVRRSQSLVEAERILLDAEAQHPNEPTVQFNLGCYACLRGDLANARRRVDRAIELDRKFEHAAATDPDLAALRALSGDARKRQN